MYQQEHNIFRQAFRKFVDQEVTPHVSRWERTREVPREAWLKMGAAGFLCPWLPEEYGGSEADFLYSAIISEELSRAGAVGFFAPLHSDIVVPYLHHLGNEAQKRKWLPGCANGTLITAIAMTEPNTGSDLAAVKTRADRQGDHFLLNGTKTFISNGMTADLIVVAARTARDVPASKGLTLFVVEAGRAGFQRGRKLDKMGLHSQDTAELIFDDCLVPATNLLGEENRGFYHLMHHLQQERLVVTIQAQAMAEAMLALTLEYIQERKAFGKPLSQFQHNAFKVVELATEIKLGRTFLDRLLQSHIDGKDVVSDVSMAKAWICEMANRVAYHCVQLHGGYGYMEEYDICRFARDIRTYPIFAGTTEIMKTIVAKNMGLL